MASETHQAAAPAVTSDDEEYVGTGYGRLAFAWITLVTIGTFTIVEGVVALTKESYYDPGAVYVVADLTTWGWIITALGVLQIAAAVYLVVSPKRGRWVALGAAGAGALGQLLFVQAYPWWTLTVFATLLFVAYSLVVHGDLRPDDRLR
jgi:hypothetical protein